MREVVRIIRRCAICLCLVAGLSAAMVPAHAQDRALLIGLDRYASMKLGRSGPGPAANDVAAIKKLLVETLEFDESAIKVLRDEKATRDAILAAIGNWLDPRASNGNQGNRSYLYFAGLGYFQRDTNNDERDGLDETLIPFDARVEGHGERAAISGMITDEELSAAIEALAGRDITVVLDTCHSGLVTRERSIEGMRISHARSPGVAPAIRSMAYDPSAALQKRESGFVESSAGGRSLAVWSAVSPSQTALIDGEGAYARGLFTRLYVEGIAEGAADANGNGIITSLELLRYVRAGSAAYCAARIQPCEMGLTPRLDPPAAYRRSVFVEPSKRKTAHEEALSFTRLSDYLVEDDGAGAEVRLIPPSPLRVGAQDIRFRVTSRKGGRLILLNLTEDGDLFQLFPNKLLKADGTAQPGRLAPNVPFIMPDDDDVLRFSATEPVKGRIVALVGPDEAELPQSIKEPPLQAVSRRESTMVYLPELAAMLGQPVHAGDPERNTAPAPWSVKTLDYEIRPRIPRGN